MLHLAYGTNSPLSEPRQIQSPSLSPITHRSSSSSPSSLSPLASSLTRSVFHSELKTSLSKSFPPQTFSFPTGLITLIKDGPPPCARDHQAVVLSCSHLARKWVALERRSAWLVVDTQVKACSRETHKC